MTTITIGGSTVVCPSDLQPYADDQPNVLVPIDGESIVQGSNNVDSFGTKNTPRDMEWSLLPTSSSDWTHTIGTLKALEGTNTTINAGTAFGGAYSTTTNIKIHSVRVEWIGKGSTDFWKVVLTYSHR